MERLPNAERKLSRGWRYVILGLLVLLTYKLAADQLRLDAGIRLLGTMLGYALLFGLYGRKGSPQHRTVYLTGAAVFLAMGLFFFFLGRSVRAW
jgi:hypothetical protein